VPDIILPPENSATLWIPPPFVQRFLVPLPGQIHAVENRTMVVPSSILPDPDLEASRSLFETGLQHPGH